MNDKLYPDARELVLRTEQCSTSLLRMALCITYTRAVNLIDLLEARGIVGPAMGSGPRTVNKPAAESGELFS